MARATARFGVRPFCMLQALASHLLLPVEGRLTQCHEEQAAHEQPGHPGPSWGLPLLHQLEAQLRVEGGDWHELPFTG